MGKYIIFLGLLFITLLYGQFELGVHDDVNPYLKKTHCQDSVENEITIKRICKYSNSKWINEWIYDYKEDYVEIRHKGYEGVKKYNNESKLLKYLKSLSDRYIFKNKKIIKIKHYKSGIILYETQIRNNLYHGQYKRYDPYNALIETATYEEGYLQGERAIYYTSGEYEYLIPYTKGVINGTIEHFNEDGEVREEVEVKAGVFVKGWAYRGRKKRKLNPAQKRRWEKMIERDGF